MRVGAVITLGAAGLGWLTACTSGTSTGHHRDVTEVTVYSDGGHWFDSYGKVSQDHLYQKSRDGFGAMIYLTTQKDFIGTFERSPFLARLEIPESAHAGEKYYALLIIFGPGKDLNGRSFVTFTGRVRDPNEHEYQEYADAIVLKDFNSAPDARLHISNSRITLQFTRESLPGDYTVDLVVTDHIKHVSLHLVQAIRLEEIRSSGHLIATLAAEPDHLAADDEVGAVD